MDLVITNYSQWTPCIEKIALVILECAKNSNSIVHEPTSQIQKERNHESKLIVLVPKAVLTPAN